MSQSIPLPKDYNPVAALVQVETLHAFMNKTCQKPYKPREPQSQDMTVNYRQLVANSRIKEQQILGCLVVEIFLANKFRATWNLEKVSFATRLNTCLDTMKTSSDALPRCVRSIVSLLLQTEVLPKSYSSEFDKAWTSEELQRCQTVTRLGLPPPSAHQFLQSTLSALLFPSSSNLHYMYDVSKKLQEYCALVRELNLAITSEDEEAVKLRIKYLCKISECKVKDVARDLERLVRKRRVFVNTDLELLLPYIRQIMEEPFGSVLAAWHLFDPIAT